MERFVIIDGNAILHRAFHAMPPLTTAAGGMVNAVYGFASMLFKIRDSLKPLYLAVTFDLPAPTFRKKIFADYQIKRPEMDKDLAGQIGKVKEMVRVLGIPIYEKEGFEADDVIGTLAFQVSTAHDTRDTLETIIVTGDRDLLQLVDENTKVYMPTKGLSEGVLFDKEKVKEKFGIVPELIPDYKGLVGDQSDNYPGVAGIGPKTAIKLLEKYGTFKNLLYCCTTLLQEEPKLGEKIIKGKEQGAMSFNLATIVRDVPVILDLKNSRVKDFDNKEAIEFFEKMGFKSLIKRLGKINSESIRQSQDKKLIVNNKKRETKDEIDSQMRMF